MIQHQEPSCICWPLGSRWLCTCDCHKPTTPPDTTVRPDTRSDR